VYKTAGGDMIGEVAAIDQKRDVAADENSLRERRRSARTRPQHRYRRRDGQFSHELNAKAGRNRFSPQRRWRRAKMFLLPLRLKQAAMSMQERAQRHVERMAGISERGVDDIETMNGPEIRQSVDRIDKIGRRTFGREDGNQHQGFSPNLLNLSNLGIETGTKRIQNPDQPV